jgi:hypothetical protein
MNEYTIKRKCWICQLEFELNNKFFYKDKKDKTGFQKRCKDCNKITNKRFQDRNPDYFNKNSVEAYERRKKENPNYNIDRYSKYRQQYLDRRSNWSNTEYGRLYDIYYAAKNRSAKKKIEFEITFENVLDMFKEQDGKCFLSGMKLDFSKKIKGVHYNPLAPSIDKIDASKGYVKGNIRIVAVIVNLSLNGFGDAMFDLMCRSYILNKYKIEVVT